MILLQSHIPNMNYEVIVCSASVEFTQQKMTTTQDYRYIYHDSVAVTRVFSQVYYNRFRGKTITTMKIFIIAFLKNDHDNFRIIMIVLWSHGKKISSAKKTYYNKQHFVVRVTPVLGNSCKLLTENLGNLHMIHALLAQW